MKGNLIFIQIFAYFFPNFGKLLTILGKNYNFLNSFGILFFYFIPIFRLIYKFIINYLSIFNYFLYNFCEFLPIFNNLKGNLFFIQIFVYFFPFFGKLLTILGKNYNWILLEFYFFIPIFRLIYKFIINCLSIIFWSRLIPNYEKLS